MYVCNSCRIDGKTVCDLSAVSAGDVSVGLAVCGYEPKVTSLPKLKAVDQNYSAGLCPGCALEKGTMFPELISEY